MIYKIAGKKKATALQTGDVVLVKQSPHSVSRYFDNLILTNLETREQYGYCIHHIYDKIFLCVNLVITKDAE